jgi:hypothetical protein
LKYDNPQSNRPPGWKQPQAPQSWRRAGAMVRFAPLNPILQEIRIMLIACAMCGGIIESSAVVALAAASMIGAEVYNRARLAVHNRRQQSARVARLLAADSLYLKLPHNPPARRPPAARLDRRELAAELAAS